MLEKIQSILDEFGVKEVWSTTDHFHETDLDDFYFVGEDKASMNTAADRVLSIVAPKIDSEDPEENESVVVCCFGVDKDSRFLQKPGLHKLVEGGKIIG